MPAPTPSALLAAALARDPARPLLTFYDDSTGERTELSVATFANWVAKTANLLQDDLGLAAGDRARLLLPVHWQAAVWLQACWALGVAAVLDGTGGADVAVVPHDRAEADEPEVVSLGLGPMGLPRPGSSPAHPGALDYDREVHGHGDRFEPATPPPPDATALVVGGREATAGALAAAALASRHPGGALLVTADPSSVDGALAATLVPLATGATVVLVRHSDPARLPARIEQEHLAAALGDTAGSLPAWRPGDPGMT